MHIFQPTAVRERVTEITPQFLQSLGAVSYTHLTLPTIA